MRSDNLQQAACEGRSEAGAEKRTEVRWASDGEIQFRLSQGMRPVVSGRLMDVAERGFRASHRMLDLASGDVVDFEFAGRWGLARAVWTRIAEGQAETGFRILDTS